MADPASLLMIEFLDWVASRPRTYAEAMDAWRTSCPRLSVWEDALIAGYIQVNGGGLMEQAEVGLTPLGRALLDGHRGKGSAQVRPAGAAEPRATPDRGVV